MPPTPLCRGGRAGSVNKTRGEVKTIINDHIPSRLLPVAWERLAGGFEALQGAQPVGSNAPKNRWLGHVAARVVASCLRKACGRVLNGFKGSGAGKPQARRPLKTDGWGMWLRELLPVACERPAGGF